MLTASLQHHRSKACGDWGDIDDGSSAASPEAPSRVLPPGGPPSTPAAPPPSQPAAFYDSQAPRAIVSERAAPTPPSATQTPQPFPDAYAHLTVQQRLAMDAELKQAEVKYGEKMRQAQAVADPAERKTKLDALRNSFSTKQSMIRKKYGVRLRERRSKAEIQAERDRMGLDSPASDPAGPVGAGSPRSSSRAGSARPRPPEHSAGNDQVGPSLPRPPKHPAGGGWTAANVPVENGHGRRAKRVKLEDGRPKVDARGGADGDSAIHNLISVSDMDGGLLGSNATAATADPSRQSTSSASPPLSTQAGISSRARIQIYEPEGVPKHPSVVAGNAARAPAVPSAPSAGVEAPRALKGPGSEGRPISISGTDAELEGPEGPNSESSSDDDEDIPARLPAAVLQSLQQTARNRG